jgi:hypothetical protein
MSDVVRVHYKAGQAQVRVGNRTLQVDRRDNGGRSYTCPIELISASLGA